MPKETKSRIGQWKWVHFKNGYCVFDPRIVIGGAKVIPQKIIVPSSTEMMDECIEKYSNTLMPFTWCVNRHNEAVVDNEGIFSVVVSRFIYQECKKYKKHIFRKHVLKWGEVTKRHMIYTFQFKFNFIELPPITIQGDAYSPAVHDLEKYHDRLPRVHYKITEDLNIVDFEYDNFTKALEECKNILVDKFGDKWTEARNRRFSAISAESIAEESKELEENQQDGLQSSYERLAGKLTGESLFMKKLELQWEDVKFYDGYFVFEPKLDDMLRRGIKVEPLREESFRCRKNFRYLLNLFKERLPKVTYYITRDFKIHINDKLSFEAALIYLANEAREADDDVEIRHNARTMYRLDFSKAISKAKDISLEELEKYKSKYINYLIAHQMKEYKVVPVTERISHTSGSHNEDSFIFTAKSLEKHLFIIVENLNTDRATIVFKVRADSYMKALRTIFDYVQSDRINKRYTICCRDVKFIDAGIIDYWRIEHTNNSFDIWVSKLRWRIK